MALFDSLNNTANLAARKGEEFLKNSEAYYKLKLFQVLTSSLGLMVKFIIVAVILMVVLILIAVALSIIIGNWLQSSVWGFLIVAALYILLIALIYLFRKQIDRIIIQNLSVLFFAEDEESKEEV
ncbi:MAG: hypothetical protein ACK5M7_10200 [Draconibacterium sp.]